MLVICVAVTIVCCASFLRATDPLLLFILFAFFAASELAFGLMVAAFFNSAKIAGIVAPLAHFACLLPRYIFFRVEAPQVRPPSAMNLPTARGFPACACLQTLVMCPMCLCECPSH